MTNLLSAFCGAAAAAVVALSAERLISRLVPLAKAPLRLLGAATAGLAFACAPAVWAQSILTEVYSLNCLLLALLLWLLVSERRRSRELGLPLIAGLALTNHLSASILVVPSIAVLGWRGYRSHAAFNWYGRAAALFAIPLLLYLLIPWRASHHPAENWGDPETLSRFVAHVTGAQYHYLLQLRDPLGAAAGVPAVLRLLLGQFAWWVLPLALYGLIRTWNRDTPLAACLMIAASGYAGFVAFYRAEGAEYYLLPAYAIEAILMGAGFVAVVSEAVAWPPIAQLVMPTRVILVAVLAALTVVPLARSNLRSHDLRHDFAARDYALRTLREAPHDATLVTNSDEQTFALWYEQKAARVRRDVHVVDVRLPAQ